jgi:anti-sigma factor RsiW
MICLSQQKDGADILVSYFERKLDATRTLALEQHIVECADCRALVGVWDTLDEWSPAALPQVSADFDARLYGRIEQESQPAWWQRWAEYFKPALPLAAGCAALALVMMQTPAPQPQTKAQMDTVSIEQVEQSLENLDLLAPVGAGAEL